jgi:hypothetical protein
MEKEIKFTELEVYNLLKKMLQIMLDDIKLDGHYHSGFCYAINLAIETLYRLGTKKRYFTTYRVNDFLNSIGVFSGEIERVFPMIWKHAPDPMEWYSGFWWKNDDAGDKLRIKILRAEIKNMQRRLKRKGIL